MTKRSSAVFIAIMMLSSCGGSDNGATSKPTIVSGGTPTTVVTTTVDGTFDKTIENLWQGTGPSNLIVAAIVANAGEFWLAYGLPEVLPTGSTAATTWQGFTSVSGFLQGTIEGSNGVLKSANIKEFTANGLNYGLNIGLKLDGTYTASTLDATLTSDNASITIRAAPAPSTSFSYAISPKLSEIIAAWSGRELLTAAAATTMITLQSTLGQKANVTLTVSKCVIKGEVIPRVTSLASENLFDVSLTAGADCDMRSNKKFSGIATNQKLASGKSQLLITAVSEDRESGVAFWASR